MSQRATSLDVFRGYAIVTMILSATVAYGVLPGWMYHAQTPPPTHAFNGSNFGITWVDLVFPFFLFAMGASFPFSLGRKRDKGIKLITLLRDSLIRGAQLTFFAIFIQHMYPHIVSAPQDTTSWLMAIGAFVLMFPMFMRIPLAMPQWGHWLIKGASYLIAVIILLNTEYAKGREFSLGFSNIIILVLANMAIFGSLAYLLTHGKRLARIAILPLVMGVFLASSNAESWTSAFFHWTPLPWLYKFYYLKYLFIVIPGSIAGEYLLEWTKQSGADKASAKPAYLYPAILIAAVGLIVTNLYCLYMRYMVLNLALSGVLVGAMYWLIKPNSANGIFWRRMLVAGTYLLALGLVFEGYEGGIRKDSSTYSFYFVTSGLAFFAMMAFSIICDVYKIRGVFKGFEMAGQNPMIAYVASSLVIMPLLNLCRLTQFLDMLNANAWTGFLRGLIVTTLAMLLAMFFTRLKWFWRT
ncbi:DUF5009 domain-containing protein [Carboxylicivirga taeanensis]|uniref:DUF5009 domain-containing protein n=1 Tax=Carboxylicivirga taeanensis TaxID=1416875 RepID=UPI003F6DD11A